MLPVTVVL